MKVRHIRRRVYRKAGGPPGYGRRCKDYFPGCLACEAYRFLDELGRFPTFDEVSPRCDAAMREEFDARTQTDEIACAGQAPG